MRHLSVLQRFLHLFVMLDRRSPGFGAPVPPPLVSEEDGQENDSGRDTEAQRGYWTQTIEDDQREPKCISRLANTAVLPSDSKGGPNLTYPAPATVWKQATVLWLPWIRPDDGRTGNYLSGSVIGARSCSPPFKLEDRQFGCLQGPRKWELHLMCGQRYQESGIRRRPSAADYRT